MKPEQTRVKDLITDTVLLLCKNGLSYCDELKIEGVIGVTLDNKDLFLVHVNERLRHDGEVLTESCPQEEGEPKDTETADQSVSQNNYPSNGNITDKSDTYFYDVGESASEETSSAVVKIEQEDGGANRPSNQIFPTPPRRMPQKRPYQRHNPSSGRQGTGNPSDMYEPDVKRFAQDQSSSRLELTSSSLEPQSWSQLDEFASQAMVVAAAAMDVPADGRLQAPPGCSSWGAGTSRNALADAVSNISGTTPTEAKYPSHALQSHNIKEALAFGVVDPLLEANPTAKIMTFRLSWFGSDSSHLDKVWQNIVTLQEQMDQFVAATAGAKVIISAYTGTLSGRTTKTDTPGVRMSYPGLAYWVLSDREQVDERLFMRQLHEQAFGARIKSLLYEYEQNKDKITNALFVVLKDCTGGFVRRKVDESVTVCAERRQGMDHPALVRLWVKDATYWDQMLAAQGRLKTACCDVSLHQL